MMHSVGPPGQKTPRPRLGTRRAGGNPNTQQANTHYEILPDRASACSAPLDIEGGRPNGSRLALDLVANAGTIR